jgi:hypothetical protein
MPQWMNRPKRASRQAARRVCRCSGVSVNDCARAVGSQAARIRIANAIRGDRRGENVEDFMDFLFGLVSCGQSLPSVLRSPIVSGFSQELEFRAAEMAAISARRSRYFPTANALSK